MSTKREHQLEDAGYQFTGEFSSEYKVGHQRMLEAAAKWRKRGYRACVHKRNYEGRITSSDGTSVYIKPKKPMTLESFHDYKARVGDRLLNGQWNVEHFQSQLNTLKNAIEKGDDYVITSILLSLSRSLDVHPQ